VISQDPDTNNVRSGQGASTHRGSIIEAHGDDCRPARMSLGGRVSVHPASTNGRDRSRRAHWPSASGVIFAGPVSETKPFVVIVHCCRWQCFQGCSNDPFIGLGRIGARVDDSDSMRRGLIIKALVTGPNAVGGVRDNERDVYLTRRTAAYDALRPASLPAGDASRATASSSPQGSASPLGEGLQRATRGRLSSLAQ
jgi:hypothetical protein